MDNFKPDIDAITRNPGALLQYRILGFMKACALHDAGELTDEEYALWKSKFPAFLGDFYDFRKQAGQPDNETFDGDAPIPSEKPQSPERSGDGGIVDPEFFGNRMEREKIRHPVPQLIVPDGGLADLTQAGEFFLRQPRLLAVGRLYSN